MMRKYFAILGSLALLVPLILSGTFQGPNTVAQEPDPSHKIGGLLAIQVEAKARAVEAGGIEPALEASSQEGRIDFLQSEGIRLEELDKQRIFIHLAQEPSQAEVKELEAMGISLYLDSWIPPVGAHPAGFLVADMPIDKLEVLAGKDYVVRLDTAERVLELHNDLATQRMNADDVWGLGYEGTGVRIAVLDSGLDVTHNDIPTPVASKDYSNWPTLDDTIANTVTGHGTHVTGSALGRGTQSGGVYKGSAPDADLIFLKVGMDNGTILGDAIVNAIKAAVDTYNADVITMSIGGWDTYQDGTSQEAQAVDYAVSQGAVVFISAGNEADDDEHYSGTVSASGETGDIQVDVSGAGSGNKQTGLAYNLVWYDGTGTSNNLELKYYDSSHTLLASTNLNQTESSRGTESEYSCYNYYVVSDGTYYLKVKNHSTNAQFFHIYYVSVLNYPDAGTVKFASPDRDYTIGSPADADDAIAVGAYTTRKYWWCYNNGKYSYASGQTVDQITTFSSRGPRVDDGAPPKPNIVAPGSAIISCRDDDVYPWPGGADPAYIDNDGPNENSPVKNDGNGPADYYVMHGTSMACPHAAGVAALILDKNPTWTPAQVKDVLESTASDKGDSGWDTIYGWGLLNASAAVAWTSNNPPNMPSNPSPAHQATGVSVNDDLSWTGGDPDAADTVNYTVYFGTNSTPPFRETIGPYAANQTSITYDPGTMNYNTKYYWKIVATDNHAASTTGLVWNFTTQLVPEISFSPSSFSFNAVEGGSNPASRTLEIWNSGGGMLNWLLTDDAAWLSENPTSGNSTGEHDSVTVSVDITGMSAGDYSANITITAAGANNTPQTVPVSLHIFPPGTVATLEGHVTFTGRGSAPDSKWIEPFNVTLFEAGNLSHVLWTGNATTNNTGVFTITGLEPRTYDIGIKNWTCLSEVNASVMLTADETTVVDFGTTREGDANNNDWIVMADLSLLLPAWNTHAGEPEYSVHYDFNRDGYVTMADLSLMLPNWNQHGDLV